ncbi:ADP-heptose-lipooligosaccharide heptosyltransferase 2 [Salmonella enterica subsp. enterica serovar Hvittingfoss str. A4-620]|nr:ADP-heptose-lipooligosaccharide heptosyltransferase 2 [Salmonella enterica subsp. enterica serovar Hvittingfoss str. A4-620]
MLPNSFKSAALIPFFANIPHRTGWRGEMRYGLLNDARVLDKDAWPLMVERYVALAYDKGVMRTAKDLPQPLLWPQLQVSEGEKSLMCSDSEGEKSLMSLMCSDFSLSSERPLIGFCPGAEFGPAKRWPHYHYAELAKQLINEGYQVVLFGSAKDHEAGNEILAALNSEQQAWCRNLAGETQLEQAVILIAACKAIVTNDSGLMHVAAALDRPLVALYGPSSPDFTPPLSHKARVIRLITGYHKVRKGDTAQGYHQSLIDITPQRVLEELHSLLSEEGV